VGRAVPWRIGPAADRAERRRLRHRARGRAHSLRTSWQIGQILFEALFRRGAGVPAVRADRGCATGSSTDGRAAGDRSAIAPRGELLALMPAKAPPDLSKFLLSPMPGLLVEVAVKARPGSKSGGERLATIEAMKMENILRAERDAVVEQQLAGAGEKRGGRSANLKSSGSPRLQGESAGLRRATRRPQKRWTMPAAVSVTGAGAAALATITAGALFCQRDLIICGLGLQVASPGENGGNDQQCKKSLSSKARAAVVKHGQVLSWSGFKRG